MAGPAILQDTAAARRQERDVGARSQAIVGPSDAGRGIVPIEDIGRIVAYVPAFTRDDSGQYIVDAQRAERIVCAFDAFITLGFQRSDNENASVRHTFGASRIIAMNRFPRSYSLTFYVEAAKDTGDGRRQAQDYPYHGVKAWLAAYDFFFRAAALAASRTEDSILMAVHLRNRVVRGAFVSTTVTMDATTPDIGVCSGTLHVTSDARHLVGTQPGATFGTPQAPWAPMLQARRESLQRVINPDLPMSNKQRMRQFVNGGGNGPAV